MIRQGVKEFFTRLQADNDHHILELDGKPIAGIIPTELVKDEKEALRTIFKEVYAEYKGFTEEKCRKIPDKAYELVGKQPQII